MSKKERHDGEILSQFDPGGNAELGLRWLMDKYQEPLFRHVVSMVGNSADSSDVLQNTFIKAYRYIGGFKRKSKLYTWLFRIGTNEALTFLEKRKRHLSVSIDEQEDEEGTVPVQLEASESVDGETAEKLLLEAIETLPPRQKQVFCLRYYDEKPYDEISELLEKSVGALKASYHHAVKRIEEYIIAKQ